MTTPVTRVRLRYIGKDGVACDDPSGIPWKRYGHLPLLRMAHVVLGLGSRT
jgi:hypothetical protein